MTQPPDDTSRPRLLIEDWLPVTELSIESVRERAVFQDLPPLFGLHIWWARRPLVASAGAILASLLPAWTAELAEQYSDVSELASEAAYRKWVLTMCGILGDPIAAKRQLNAANAAGVRLKGNGYGYKQAFKNNPTTRDVALLHEILCYTWKSLPSILDPTAGGGSIPFESIRYRLPTYANDLNSVATAVLHAGIRIPAVCGVDFIDDLQYWGTRLVDCLSNRLANVFIRDSKREPIIAYIWARTITCPTTGKLVPLVSDWSLRRASKGKTAVAVKLITHRSTGEELDGPVYKIVEGSDIDFDPKAEATYRRGKAISPWNGMTIDGDYIRSEAQAGRMGDTLYAIAVHTAQGRGFREPGQTDFDALAKAESELERLLPEWEAHGTIPIEAIPGGNKTRDLHNYGKLRWQDLFTPRQLLVHGCFVEEYCNLIDEVRSELGEERANAVLGALGMVQGKAINWNSRICAWHVNRQIIGPTFTIHAFPFKSTFVEFDGSMQLYQWCLKQNLRAYYGLTDLLSLASDESLIESEYSEYSKSVKINITQGSGGNLAHIKTGSITSVVIDPPYFDNVMYAELSDFFYVWEKHTLGVIWPDIFCNEFTNKRDEAVANPARFISAGKDKAKVANDDYEAKMAAIFNECHRVLRDDGVLTVMFTHKSAGAWDGLGSALLQAGFTIETSWPVSTEPTTSMHQARQNSAASTIFLACRKRPARRAGGRVYLSGIEAGVRAAAGEALRRSADQGLTGVDLLLSTYGPALSVLSQAWPVHSTETTADGTSRLLFPEEALDVARDEVVRLMTNRLVGREVSFDAHTDFVLIAWSVFGARTFPFDDARRLALATGGLDIDELKRAKLLTAKSGNVALTEPTSRLAQGDGPGVKRDRHHFERLMPSTPCATSSTTTERPPLGIGPTNGASLSTTLSSPACRVW